MNVFDIGILCLGFIFILIGIKKGLIGSIGSIIGWVAGLVVASLLASSVAELFLDTGFGQNLVQKLEQWIADKGEIFSTAINISSQEMIAESLTEIGIPTFLHSFIIGEFEASVGEISLASYIAPKIALCVFECAAYFVLYIITVILVKIMVKILKKIIHSTSLGILDSILGAVWGCARTVLIISIIFLIINLLTLLPGVGQNLSEFMTKTLSLNDDSFGIAKYLYENNFIILVFDKMGINI